MNFISRAWRNHPLRFVLILALFTRLIAVFYSGGYGYHDDHFLVVEPAQSWLNGLDRDNMITDDPSENTSGRSLLYPGINYIIFGAMEFLGIHDPSTKMLLNRLIHALYSLLTIYFGYKLVQMLDGPDSARVVSLMLAVFWMFPEISVRNLVEVVPVPLLMLASYWVVGYLKGERDLGILLFTGLLLGICFSLRYQTILFSGGIGLGLLLMGRWKATIYLAISVLGSILLLHGVGDYFFCGSPFCKVSYYFLYNVDHATDYTTEPWHFYLGIFLGVLVPPLSILLIFGFFRSYKISLVLWLATLLFFVFHSAFPNKQERFIFTIMPHMILLGYLGWRKFVAAHDFGWIRNLERFAWIFFWVLNIPLVLLYSSYDNKTARIEGMEFLGQQEDFSGFIIFDHEAKRIKDPPQFYANKFEPFVQVNKYVSPDSLRDILSRIPEENYPNYLIIPFNRTTGKAEMEEAATQFVPDFEYLQTFEMGWIDALRNKINKNIELDDWAIYRIQGERQVPYDPDKTGLKNIYR